MEKSITVAGTTVPVVANTIVPALNIWMAASFTPQIEDMTWAPNKPRVAAFTGDVSYTYSSCLSIVRRVQSVIGDSEATTVAADPDRVLGAMNLISVTA